MQPYFVQSVCKAWSKDIRKHEYISSISTKYPFVLFQEYSVCRNIEKEKNQKKKKKK